MNLIDIHTHAIKGSANLEIINLYAQELATNSLLQPCTAGFHPWHLNDYDERAMMNLLHDLSSRPQIVGIGECGIDLSIGIGIEKQERIFLKQAGIAEIAGKPLIIHCVKAYNEITSLHKQMKARVPWIFHGYAAKPQITKLLLKHNFYFSFGEALLNEKQKAADSLKIIPAERIFFETDESNLPVSEIYSVAAKILKMDIEKLEEQVSENYRKVFGHGEVETTDITAGW